jgi:hypothetical protein
MWSHANNVATTLAPNPAPIPLETKALWNETTLC